MEAKAQLVCSSIFSTVGIEAAQEHYVSNNPLAHELLDFINQKNLGHIGRSLVKFDVTSLQTFSNLSLKSIETIANDSREISKKSEVREISDITSAICAAKASPLVMPVSQRLATFEDKDASFMTIIYSTFAMEQGLTKALFGIWFFVILGAATAILAALQFRRGEVGNATVCTRFHFMLDAYYSSWFQIHPSCSICPFLWVCFHRNFMRCVSHDRPVGRWRNNVGLFKFLRSQFSCIEDAAVSTIRVRGLILARHFLCCFGAMYSIKARVGLERLEHGNFSSCHSQFVLFGFVGPRSVWGLLGMRCYAQSAARHRIFEVLRHSASNSVNAGRQKKAHEGLGQTKTGTRETFEGDI